MTKNIVYIKLDDMPKWFQAEVSLLTDFLREGIRFSQARNTVDLCGPNRAASWTGRYPHVTGCYDNVDSLPNLLEWGLENTVPAQLKANGWKTAKFGKAINNSPIEDNWDTMFNTWGITDQGDDLNFLLNHNGDISEQPRTGESEENLKLGSLATNVIDAWYTDTEPFYLELTPHDPHSPYYDADLVKGYGTFQWRPSNYNIVHSSQPSWIRNASPLGTALKAEIDEEIRNKLRETVLVMKNLVWPVVNKLKSVGIYNNTYVILDADNGWQTGEHRLTLKGYPYEESQITPLIICGGGLPLDVIFDHLVASIDIPSTIVDLAGLSLPTDGRSLRPFLEGTPPATYAFRRVQYCEGPHADWTSMVDEYLWKTISNLGTNEHETYDLAESPKEYVNRRSSWQEYVDTNVAKMARMQTLSGDGLRAEEMTLT